MTESVVRTCAGKWKKIMDHNNESNTASNRKITLTEGNRDLTEKSRIIKDGHEAGVDFTLGGKIKKILKVALKLSYSYNHEETNASMTQHEVYNSKEEVFDIPIPAKTRIVLWQLVADVQGYEIGFSVHSQTNGDPPNQKITCGRVTIEDTETEIRDGVSFRIKHVKTGMYINTVGRKGWEAATLGISEECHFTLGTDGSHVRLILKNPMYGGYDALYSADQGGIYFDQRSGNEKQWWKISKAKPNDLDIVTFGNKFWPSSFLCKHAGPATDVYCLNQQGDEWQLLVA